MILENIDIYTFHLMDGVCKMGPGAFSSVLHQRLAAGAGSVGWRKNKDGSVAILQLVLVSVLVLVLVLVLVIVLVLVFVVLVVVVLHQQLVGWQEDSEEE